MKMWSSVKWAGTASLPVVLTACEVAVNGDDISIGITVGVFTFAVANVLYGIWRHQGHPDALRRLVAFWLGFPLTLLSYLLIDVDTAHANRQRTASMDVDDPRLVEADFQQELALLRMQQAIESREAIPNRSGEPRTPAPRPPS